MTRNQKRIRIGNVAGHRFVGTTDIEVVFHCRRDVEFGYYHVRKWLANRAAFDYDQRYGWVYDRWFVWPNETKKNVTS